MKKFILFSMTCLLAASGLAASRQVLTAVLNSEKTGNVQDVDKVEVVATYRCPNCYDIAINGTNMFGKAYVKVRTSQNIGESLEITYLEGSK